MHCFLFRAPVSQVTNTPKCQDSISSTELWGVMSTYERSRKAVGSSSEPLRQNQRKTSSASQPKYKYERPPPSPYNNTPDGMPYVQPLPATPQPEASSARRMSSQLSARPQYHEVSDDDTSFRSARDGQSSKKSETSVLLDNEEEDDDDDKDWDMLEREAPNAKVSATGTCLPQLPFTDHPHPDPNKLLPRNMAHRHSRHHHRSQASRRRHILLRHSTHAIRHRQGKLVHRKRDRGVGQEGRNEVRGLDEPRDRAARSQG